MIKLADGPIILNEVMIIFRNIEDILDLHQQVILPLFKRAQDNPFKITNMFKDLIESGGFHRYLDFCFGKNKADQLCDQHLTFFENLSKEKNAKLSAKEFLDLPYHACVKYSETIRQLFLVFSEFFSNSNDVKFILEDLENVGTYFEEIISEMNRAVTDEKEELTNSTLVPKLQLPSNIEKNLLAGIHQTLCPSNKSMDISVLKTSEKK